MYACLNGPYPTQQSASRISSSSWPIGRGGIKILDLIVLKEYLRP